MKVIVFNDFSEELQYYWKSLERFNSDLYVFQSFDWNFYWYNKIGKYTNVIIHIVVIIDKDEKPIMLIPLSLKRYFVISVLSFLGDRQHDYNNILFFQSDNSVGPSFNDLWNFAFRYFPKFDFLYLNKIPCNSFYVRSNIITNSLFTHESNKAHFTMLPSDFETLVQSKKRKKIKADIHRQIRRLSELGKLTFEIIDDAATCTDLMKFLIEQKRERFKSTSVPDSLDKEYLREFYYDIFHDDPLKYKCHFSILKLDNEVLAYHWGITDNNVFYYLMPTFNSNYSNYSPGKILIYKLLSWSIENNFKIFDFTIGSEEYKNDWADNYMIIYEYTYVRTPLGYLASVFFQTFAKIRHNKTLWDSVRRLYRFIKIY